MLCAQVILSSQHLLDLSLDSTVTVSQIHSSTDLTEVADILEAQVTVWSWHYLFLHVGGITISRYKRAH